MSVSGVSSRSFSKWLPAVVVPVVVVAGALVIPMQAGAADLPNKTPEQLLLMVSDSSVTAFSGTVEKTASLGLPDLSLTTGLSQSMIDELSKDLPAGYEDFVPGGATVGLVSSALEVLSGTQTAQVYASSPGNLRVQVKGRLAERTLVANDTDAWLYDSQTDIATHVAIPAGYEDDADARLEALRSWAPADLSTPAAAVSAVLDELDKTTAVTVGEDTEVAGRSAYELVLTPKAGETLVESATIAIDAETGLPLSLDVRAVGQEASAFEVAFTAISFDAPDAALFDWTAPAGATVEEQTVPSLEDSMGGSVGDSAPLGSTLPTKIGDGWSTIVSIDGSGIPAGLLDSGLVDQLATAVDGGKLLHTSLANVLLTDDGRVFAGAVSAEQLQAAAAQ